MSGPIQLAYQFQNPTAQGNYPIIFAEESTPPSPVFPPGHVAPFKFRDTPLSQQPAGTDFQEATFDAIRYRLAYITEAQWGGGVTYWQPNPVAMSATLKVNGRPISSADLTIHWEAIAVVGNNGWIEYALEGIDFPAVPPTIQPQQSVTLDFLVAYTMPLKTADTAATLTSLGATNFNLGLGYTLFENLGPSSPFYSPAPQPWTTPGIEVTGTYI